MIYKRDDSNPVNAYLNFLDEGQHGAGIKRLNHAWCSGETLSENGHEELCKWLMRENYVLRHSLSDVIEENAKLKEKIA